MKFNCSKESLMAALSIAQKQFLQKPTMKILGDSLVLL